MRQYLLEVDGYDAAAAVGTSPVPTFTRATIAHKKDGSQVASGAARFEPGRMGEAIMIEEGTTNLCLVNTETAAGTEFTSGSTGATIGVTTDQFYSGAKSIAYLYGSSGSANIYLNGTAYHTQTAGTSFTFSVKVKRSDGAPVSGLTAYLYVSNNSNVNGSCTITPLRDGWYRCSYTRTGLTSGAVSFSGLTGLPTTTTCYFDDWQVEAKTYFTSFVFGTRNVENCSIDSTGVIADGAPFTIEAWVKFDSLPPSSGMICADWTKFYLNVMSNGQLRISYYDPAQLSVTSATPRIIGGNWHHVAMVFTGAAVSGYVNGINVIPATATTLPSPTTGALNIGRLSTGYYLNGLIDDLRISNRARTAAEIAAIYARGMQGIPAPWDDACTALLRFDVAGIRTGYFCTGTGYIDGNITYLPRIKQPGNIKTAMFQDGRTGGASQVGYGDVTLLNLDGGLDHLREYGYDGQKLVIKGVDEIGISILFTGTQQQPVFTWDDISFVVRDKQTLFNTPLQPNKFLGNNALPAGLEGVDDLKGRPKPLLYGEVHNISPPLVNTSKLTYQVNDGAVASIDAVYDRGVALTPGANYATAALLQAATPAAGAFDTCLAEGYFRLGSTPSGAITANVKQGATVANRTAAQIAQGLALRVIPQADIYAQGIITVDAANSGVIGIYAAEETTVAAALDEVADSIGAWHGFDGNGKWNLRIMTAPGSNPLTVLTDAENISIERVSTSDKGGGVPIKKYLLQYDKNYTVQTDLAGSSARLPYTSKEYRTATPAVDNTVATKHLLAGEMTGKSLLVDAAAAATEATRRLNLYKVERDPLKVKCPVEALEIPFGGWWDDKAISEMATARHKHATVVHNNFLYVIGGILADEVTITASVIRLDLSNPTGDWDDAGVTNLPAARAGHAAVVYGNKLYVLGGSTGASTASVIQLDLTNPAGAWVTAAGGGDLPDLPAARYYHSAVINGSDLYILGGNLASVIRISLTTPTAWDDAGVTDLPAARSNFVAVIYSGYLYVIGGYVNFDATASVIRLNLAAPTGAWDDAGVTDLPAGKELMAGILLGSYVYLIGGNMAGIFTDTATWKLNLAAPAGPWITGGVTPLPAGRSSAGAVLYSGSIYLVAGFSGATPTPKTYCYRSNDNPLDRARVFELGQDIQIKTPRYGYDAGKNFKIIGNEVDYETETITLDLWG